jgi:hypothetical protein
MLAARAETLIGSQWDMVVRLAAVFDEFKVTPRPCRPPLSETGTISVHSVGGACTIYSARCVTWRRCNAEFISSRHRPSGGPNATRGGPEAPLFIVSVAAWLGRGSTSSWHAEIFVAHAPEAFCNR